MYMKHCKVLIEPTAEIKVKKTGAKQTEGSAGGKGRGKRS